MHMSSPSSTPTTSTRASSPNKATQKTLEMLRHLDGEHRVCVGLSGGVDSSLTAALLVEAEWDVEGITLWLMSGKGACCSEGLVDAAGICKQLGILHHVIDSRDTFHKEIVEELIHGYQDGITPLPCSRCNRLVKFTPMIQWAESQREINRIATGHYARVRGSEDTSFATLLPGHSKDRIKLLRGLDKNKDQSYFLYDLSQEVLNKVVFPLGELTKSETRQQANKFNLRTAEKPESQDLCLVDHHGSMKAFLDSYISPKKGSIVLKDGRIIGEHDGIEHFTIGQRKGLRVSWKEPLHVVQIDAENNKIVVAPRADAGQSSCIVGSINWISIEPPKETINVEVQARYRSRPVKAKLTPLAKTSLDERNQRPYRCILHFEEEQFSITPGQAAVFYAEELVLGGGLIERNISE